MRVISVVVSLLALSACQMFSGVRREAYLDSTPTAACVQQAIARTPGVATVEYHQTESSGFTVVGMVKQTSDHFHFTGAADPEIRGTVTVTDFDKTTDTFSSALYLAREPAQAERVSAGRAIMVAIEGEIAAACGLSLRGDAVKETCSGVNCRKT